MYKLRQYQEDAVSSAIQYINGGTGNGIVCMPTGTGKSVVIAEIIRRMLEVDPWYRVIMLTHVKELIKQNAEKLRSIWYHAPLGVHSAGLDEREINFPIIFGGVQSVLSTIKKQPMSFGRRNLLLIDECHLLGPNEDTSYQRVIGTLRGFNPDLKIMGFTATPYRLKNGLLTDGNIFGEVCFNNSRLDDFNKLIEDGYLAPLIPKQTKSEIDLSDVKIVGGDYKKDELQAAALKDMTTQRAINELLDQSAGRKKWLIFSSGIDHAELITNILKDKGVNAACVHSKKADAENDTNIAALKSGDITALVNSDKLTTGFDCPDIDLIGMLRPTTSPGLWVQMLGRGTRPHPDKKDCLVLDFAGNTARLGPINDPVIPTGKTGKKTGDVPIKICENCGVYNHASVRICCACGYEFPVKSKLKTQASIQELIRSATQIKTLDVKQIFYSQHIKPNSPPSLKVTYFCGLKKIDEWVCIEHANVFARNKAVDWLKTRLPENHPIPKNVNDALNIKHLFKIPCKIDVTVNTKYPEIKEWRF